MIIDLHPVEKKNVVVLSADIDSTKMSSKM